MRQMQGFGWTVIVMLVVILGMAGCPVATAPSEKAAEINAEVGGNKDASEGSPEPEGISEARVEGQAEAIVERPALPEEVAQESLAEVAAERPDATAEASPDLPTEAVLEPLVEATSERLPEAKPEIKPEISPEIPGGTRNTRNKAASLWRGFHYEWERTIAGFQTPHRIGSFACTVEKEEHIAQARSWASEATILTTFAPGVDGDFAEPKSHYSAIYSPHLYTWRGSKSFTFTDTSVKTPVPKAETSLREPFVVDLSVPELGGGQLDQYTALLRGFRMKVACDQAKQPAGETCNSNGIWPHRLYFGVEACKKVQSKLECSLKIDIFRSYTPQNGGGKPYNSRMDFEIHLDLLVVGGKQADFAATLSPMITRTGQARQGLVSGTSAIQGKPGFSKAALGLAAFGFTLLKTGNNDDLGRYLTFVSFLATEGAYNPTTGQMPLTFDYGVKVPMTTVATDARYEIQPVLLQLGPDSRVIRGKTAQTKICFNGFGFSCQGKGLAEQTTDRATIQTFETW